MIEAEDIAQALVPPLKPYVIFESADPPVSFPDSYGHTYRHLDGLLRDWLVERGAWRGRQPCVVLCDRVIARHFGGDDAQLMATLIHECGHVVDWGITTPSPIREAKALARAAYRTRKSFDDIALPPWHLHGAGWIRAVLHLTYRVGFSRPDLLFDASQFEIAPASDFAEILRSEVAEFQNVNIFNLSKLAPPEAFMMLWDQCVRAWIRRQSTYTEAASIAIRSLYAA